MRLLRLLPTFLLTLVAGFAQATQGPSCSRLLTERAFKTLNVQRYKGDPQRKLLLLSIRNKSNEEFVIILDVDKSKQRGMLVGELRKISADRNGYHSMFTDQVRKLPRLGNLWVTSSVTG